MIAIIVLTWVAALVVLHWNGQRLDTTAIYYAAKSWAAGLRDLVYAPGPVPFLVEPTAQWVDWAGAEDWETPVHFTPYLYPPLWAVLLAPLADAVSARAFFNGALVVYIASALWTVWLSWRLLAPRQVDPVTWVALSLLLLIATAPGYLSFDLGQPQLMVAAITLASFVALSNGRDLAAGGLLALAAALKLSPALLVVIFVMERRWRALCAFTVIGAALGAASVALADWPLHVELLDKLAQIEARVLVSRILVGLELVLFQLGEVIAGRAQWVIGHPRTILEPLWITWTTRGVLVVGLALVWWTSRDVAPRLRLWLRVLGVLLVTLIANPLGWVHYLVLPFLMLPGFLEVAERPFAARVIGFTLLVFSMPVYLGLTGFAAGDWVQVAINFGASVVLVWAVLRVARREANP